MHLVGYFNTSELIFTQIFETNYRLIFFFYFGTTAPSPQVGNDLLIYENSR
jgi:hypothetical protein